MNVKFQEYFIERLTRELQQPLPGESAQYRMAPGYRPRLKPEYIAAQNPKIGGVMLLIFERNGDLRTVFTKRREYEGVHSGQMSFPGGKKDEADADVQQTALRETKEEVGVEPEQIQVIGSLSSLYIPPSNFLVYPTVGYSSSISSFSPQQKEVAEVVEIPLDFFMDTRNVNLQTEITVYGGTKVKAPAYIYGPHIIWGATAIILSEFSYLLEKIKS